MWQDQASGYDEYGNAILPGLQQMYDPMGNPISGSTPEWLGGAPTVMTPYQDPEGVQWSTNANNQPYDFGEDFWRQLGYTGQDPWTRATSQDLVSGTGNDAGSMSPGLQSYLQQQGYTLNTGLVPNSNQQAWQYFDANGQPVGARSQGSPGNLNFGNVAKGLLFAIGGSALGAAAGGTGGMFGAGAGAAGSSAAGLGGMAGEAAGAGVGGGLTGIDAAMADLAAGGALPGAVPAAGAVGGAGAANGMWDVLPPAIDPSTGLDPGLLPTPQPLNQPGATGNPFYDTPVAPGTLPNNPSAATPTSPWVGPPNVASGDPASLPGLPNISTPGSVPGGGTSGGGTGASTTNPMAQFLPGLLSLWNSKNQDDYWKRQQDELNKNFSTDSPYAQQMAETLARKDSAAGRNSQYGPRAVNLAADLAKAKAEATSNLMQMGRYSQEAQNSGIRDLASIISATGGGVGSGSALDWTGVPGQIKDWWNQLFGEP